MITFFTSESVTEGHPDKVCDQISDGILDALLAADPMSRCACEVTCEPGAVHIMGEITTAAKVDYEAVAREVIRGIGYTKDEYGFNCDTCRITVSLHEQSPDIALGVDHSLETKEGDEDGLGAGDQGMMFGYACDETPEFMPLSLSLAHKLTRRLTEVRKSGLLSYLRPDGKSQVTVQYDDGVPVRVDAVVLSAQHDPDVGMAQLQKDLLETVVKKAVSSGLIDSKTRFYINPTGRFVYGGPAADTGLTGRKIIVDTYGGAARHGGGAFSGKDPTKVDRSAAYMARRIAKTIVAAGAAGRCEVQLGYAIGVAKPVSLRVETFGTGLLPEDTLAEWVNENFDTRPTKIIRQLDLRRPIYLPTASYGHFGRENEGFTWEETAPELITELERLVDVSAME